MLSVRLAVLYIEREEVYCSNSMRFQEQWIGDRSSQYEGISTTKQALGTVEYLEIIYIDREAASASSWRSLRVCQSIQKRKRCLKFKDPPTFSFIDNPTPSFLRLVQYVRSKLTPRQFASVVVQDD